MCKSLKHTATFCAPDNAKCREKSRYVPEVKVTGISLNSNPRHVCGRANRARKCTGQGS